MKKKEYLERLAEEERAAWQARENRIQNLFESIFKRLERQRMKLEEAQRIVEQLGGEVGIADEPVTGESASDDDAIPADDTTIQSHHKEGE